MQPQITTAVTWYFIQHSCGERIPADDFPKLALLSARAEKLPAFQETSYG